MPINGKKLFVAAAINTTGLVAMQAGFFMLKRKMHFGAYTALVSGSGLLLLSVHKFRKACFPFSRSELPRILPADEHQPNADDLQDVPVDNAAAENVPQDVAADNAAAENVLQDVAADNAAAENVIKDVAAEDAAAENVPRDVPAENAAAENVLHDTTVDDEVAENAKMYEQRM